MPEPPWETPPPPEVAPREERLAEARARRAARLAAPSSPAPTPADRPEPAKIQSVRKLDSVVTKEDAEFAAWRRAQYAWRHGRSRGGRSKR
jgi:hypothetical protein